jgi:hypothetical protein
MTDYGLVRTRLGEIAGFDQSQLEAYESYIVNAVSSVSAILKDTDSENDARIINLCAVKANYQILLTGELDDDIVSFTAGDVSYTKDTSSISRAKALLDSTLSDCSDLVISKSFAFKAV